jgi:hypothetical protein
MGKGSISVISAHVLPLYINAYSPFLARLGVSYFFMSCLMPPAYGRQHQPVCRRSAGYRRTGFGMDQFAALRLH